MEKELKRGKSGMKKVFIRLITMIAVMGVMLGMAVVVLANSPVLNAQTVAETAINSNRAIVAAAFAIVCGILAFTVRHSR